jgi:P-type E1-E2 ATPase
MAPAPRPRRQGQRVLALRDQACRARQAGSRFADVEAALTLLGMVGFIDPPREEAIDAVATAAAGIRVKMITGDHAVTAREIARQLGLADDPRC